MTTITIPDAILSQIQPGEQAVEVCDATGRVVGYFAPVATAEDYRKACAHTRMTRPRFLAPKDPCWAPELI